MSFGIPVRNGLMLGLTASTALSTRGGFPAPALSLDFLSGTLDSRITFSRGTNATLIDSTGKLTYAPNNLATWSEDFSNAIWTSAAAGLTVATDAAVAPNGTTTADKLAETATTDTHRRGFAISSLARTQYVFSVYAKAAERTILRGWSFSGGDTNEQTFNLANGTCTGSLNPIITPVGNGWYRCSFTVPAANTGSVVFGPSDGTGGTNAYLGVAGSGIFVWGAQLEAVTYQTTPSTYVATTASAYYGPRFDYDPVTLAPRGLLIEEARTNLLTYSDAFDNTTGWPTATNITITANATASPDGTVNADRFDDGTTASVQHRLFRSPVTFTATAHTCSISVKAGTGAWFQLVASDGTTVFYANFNAATGALGNRQAATTSTITDVGNGWYRCTMTATTAAAAGNVQIGMLNTDAPLTLPSFTGANRTLFFYGAQLEAGSFATSYTPTVASTVTRNADVATMTGTNFSSWYNQSEGTFAAQYDSYLVDTNTRSVLSAYASGATSNNILLINAVQRQFQINDAGTQADLDGGTPASGAVVRAAGAYKVNDFALSLDGGTVVTDTVGTVPTVNTLGIGISPLGLTPVNGHIRTFTYFNTCLPSNRLAVLSR